MQNIDRFFYNYANLSLYQFQGDWGMVLVALIGAIVGVAVLFYLFRFISIYGKVQEEQETFAKRKKLLDDLVLMKDIQTELEKEIEQAILKATFQS